jgi:hypothetical protein
MIVLLLMRTLLVRHVLDWIPTLILAVLCELVVELCLCDLLFQLSFPLLSLQHLLVFKLLRWGHLKHCVYLCVVISLALRVINLLLLGGRLLLGPDYCGSRFLVQSLAFGYGALSLSLHKFNYSLLADFSGQDVRGGRSLCRVF